MTSLLERKTTHASEICSLTLAVLESINHSVGRKTVPRERHILFVHDLRNLLSLLSATVTQRYQETGSSDEQARLKKALEHMQHNYDELEDYLSSSVLTPAPLFVPNERKQ